MADLVRGPSGSVYVLVRRGSHVGDDCTARAATYSSQGAASHRDQPCTWCKGVVGVKFRPSSAVPNIVSKEVASPARPTPRAFNIASFRVHPRRNATSRI